ncbi:TRAP transporter large permease [Clostridium formicaceticum]|uniref:C4-dicarboxylate ABC transporter permease n=1 Tax=Clostridium formicaceticum TaxID=1497 RepID=A0AAC9RJ10_9CLOT|nr:TRAP transporter large permease [Clostridium formicaceticum]AOY76092.1 C4-dicarboxylate ABC transporter permease [Clostridium formicaceticum]ARE86454.1 Sialic acid TRAP transporter permease protein SiaT [Clostridium formicaceticum]
MGTAETVLIVTLLITMLAGVPITWSLGLASMLSIAVNSRLPITVISQRLFTGSDSFSMLAIPAFILAGDIMSKGGLSKRLVNFANSLVGWIAGGVSLVSLVACTFFAAISGSSVATTAAIGGLMYPEMVDRGYPKDYSSAVQAIGGTLGIVIPPSIVLVIYGNITGVSVADLLMAGIIPGIICGIALCVMAYFIAKKQNFPKEAKFVPKNLAVTFKDAIWALIMPVIILGGIYSGVFTPTESAAVAVFYGIIVCVFIYKELTFKDLWPIMKETAKSSANLMMLVVTAQLFGWLITYYKIPIYVTEVFMTVASNKYIFLILVNLLLIIAGMFMEVGATNLILAPILAPIAVAFGVDPVQFGMVFVFLLAMGQATPPFGTTMFVASGISKEPVSRVAKQILPFTAVQIACALLFSFVPILSTLLPSLLNK